MKKKKSGFMDKIGACAVIVVFLALSKGCISDYVKGGDNKAISNYEKMLFDSSIATAMLEPEYKITTVKIMHVPVKTYAFRYKFFVGTHSYGGGVTYSAMPEKYTLPVFYLKEDPNFNSTNPAGALKAEKEKNTSKSPLYWGIAWGVLGLLCLLGFVGELRGEKGEEQAVAAG
ncbi:MAG: hypothetical protein JST68_08050 [Bacteroidetes bacterium]|nr:hypothetical protein [Bacteroidota bacterium]